ncbi:DNA-binding response OmpR family regulator [Salinibacterium amurskyense]|uniref:DNA-binding response OmpR family regulator n=1 Tax=Salinibacterium amurskyense TaxID=205941 RepID=A0A2M9D355_9MICO|nr:response regulator transcription factor [Salinibacterium amurskyense]PJJ78616.1 DNA-binding response OmpR family regulator [Salinibacterium amurskyense]RLQ80701.1 DNA-binding response regulator [Salinibacterium amurskyense]GHD82910.1 DNA-binding response regulator [Salinibacterium amurskyense]
MENQPSVTIVEDDATVLSVVTEYLRGRGYSVTGISDGIQARDALRGPLPDVLILDRMLPGVGGDELCRQARAASPQLPIIMLTALDAVEERIDGLEHGADDYIAKPFSLRELQLRVDAMVRRTRSSHVSSEPFTLGQFRVDPAHRKILLDGNEMTLTTREYELFLFLLQNPERVLSRDDILREVWGWSFGEASTVTVHVRRLREKIEPEPRYPRFLLTEWGKGYRFTVKDAA